MLIFKTADPQKNQRRLRKKSALIRGENQTAEQFLKQ